MSEEMAFVGKRYPLRTGHAKVTGELKFTQDRNISGQLWMKILRSPHPHARIMRIDVSEAQAMPGVEAVLTYKDVPQKDLNCMIRNFRGRILEDRVRFVGDEVAAVAAETEELAEQALACIEADYEKLPAVFDTEKALEQGAPDVTGTGNNKIIWAADPEEGDPWPYPYTSAFTSEQSWGNIEKGFREAEAIVEHEVQTSRQYPAFIPGACRVSWDGNKLTIMMGHQALWDIRRMTALALGLSERQIKIVAPAVPGAFGQWSSSQRFWCLASLLAMKTGKAIAYNQTMEEFAVYKSRESETIHVKIGGKKDGTVTALDYSQIMDNGGYGRKGTPYQQQHDIFNRTNVNFLSFGVATNKFNTGCYRGVGDVPQALAISQAMDMLAEKLGLDPFILWKKNHHRAGEVLPFYNMPNVTLSSEAYDELIDKGAKAIEWKKKWKGWAEPYQVIGPKQRGVGLAVGLHISGLFLLPASAMVEINHDGTAQVMVGSIDLGTGSKTSLAQIAAEVLGFRLEDVYVVKEVDTETVPYMCMTAASSCTTLGGSVVKIAAADAKRQLLEMAHTVPWSPACLREGISGPDDLDIKEGMVYVKADPSRCAKIAEVISDDRALIPLGVAHRHDIPLGDGPAIYQTLAAFADLEVDTETGRIDVLKVVGCHDAGRIVNPDVCENQVYAGIMQSFGYGLMEEVAFDPATGRVLNSAVSNYAWPTALDAPDVEAIFSDNIDPVGPLGAKSLGESPDICPHGAIANAVYSAVGVRMTALPMTPDRILEALGKTG
jgi:xanthine dehydrogenase molybdenum-binding subunit